MKHPVLECALIATLMTGVSGGDAFSQPATRKEASGQPGPLSAGSEPVRAVALKLTGAGQIVEKEKL